MSNMSSGDVQWSPKMFISIRAKLAVYHCATTVYFSIKYTFLLCRLASLTVSYKYKYL